MVKTITSKLIKNTGKITSEQVTEYLLNYESEDFSTVKHLITPNIDLFVLTLLVRAQKQGLDIAFVDTEKLQSVTIEDLIEGEEINFSLILFTGYSFTYENNSWMYCFDDGADTLNIIDDLFKSFNKPKPILENDFKLATIAAITTCLNEPPKKVRSVWYKRIVIAFELLKVLIIALPLLLFHLIKNMLKDIGTYYSGRF